MRIDITEEGPDQLVAYGTVPIAFDIYAANRGAYPALPAEVQLLWYKKLDVQSRTGLWPTHR
jgi:hypothetical protein